MAAKPPPVLFAWVSYLFLVFGWIIMLGGLGGLQNVRHARLLHLFGAMRPAHERLRRAFALRGRPIASRPPPPPPPYARAAGTPAPSALLTHPFPPPVPRRNATV